MAETLRQFDAVIRAPDGTRYQAQACGAEMTDGMWEGWIEFVPLTDGKPLRSPRETTQPNRGDAVYWASGLTAVYLEGALTRALNPLVIVPPAEPPPPMFSEPARPIVAQPRGAEVAQSVLDPFSVYEKGEPILRKQLASLASWHLVNILRDYELSSEEPAVLNQLPSAVLIELIVAAVRNEAAARSVAARK